MFLSGMSEYRQNVSNPILCAFAMCLYKVRWGSQTGRTMKVSVPSSLGFSSFRLVVSAIYDYLNLLELYWLVVGCWLMVRNPIFS